jgi:hypothetical protein
MEVISSVSKWGRLKRWDKKNRGLCGEDVLMSRKWGGIEGARKGGGGRNKNVANYSCENKSAIIYERVFVADTVFSS